MTQTEVIALIQAWIIANGNEEITADVLRPILEAMVNQPNELIGDLGNLNTSYQDDLVGAINEVRTLAVDNSGVVIYYGTDLPDVHTFPSPLTPANFYVQLDGSTVLGMWAYNGNEWIAQIPQRTKTVKKFVSLVGITTTGKSQVQWMADAINLNISNGAVYECEDGDVIDFFVNISTSIVVDAASIRRIYTRLCTGATSVTSVVANDLMPDGSEDIPVTGDLIVELGDIGTADVWTAFNADPSQPFAMTDEKFVSAVQNSEPKLWQWIGGTGSFGSTGTPAVEADFLDLTAQPTVPIGQLYNTYNDIPTMLLEVSQASQSTEQLIVVLDASADTNITFPIGETKLQAYYQKLATDTGSIDDYRLVSAPYGNKLDAKPLVTLDTATVITLYPFGNFCNSYAPNLEDTSFTFALTDADNPAGETATVLIKTSGVAVDFPTLTDAEYVEGAPFAIDSYYDLHAWHNGATVAYTFLSRSAPPPDPTLFVTTWKTDNAGTSGSTSITIPVRPLFFLTYNYEVSWKNDGVWESFNTDTPPTHDYGVAGTYEVAIRGIFPQFFFNGGNDNLKLLTIEQWGNIAWDSFFHAFSGCDNLVINATDIPDLSNVTNFGLIFSYCGSINDVFNDWDVSNVTNMQFAFLGSGFNGDLSNWDVRNVTNMGQMLQGTPFSSINYDALLIAWASLPSLQTGVPFHAGTAKYSAGAAATARGILTGTYGWTITDGGPL